MISLEKFKNFLESNFDTKDYSISIDEDFESADIFIKSKDPNQEFSILVMPNLIGIGLSNSYLKIDFSLLANGLFKITVVLTCSRAVCIKQRLRLVKSLT